MMTQPACRRQAPLKRRRPTRPRAADETASYPATKPCLKGQGRASSGRSSLGSRRSSRMPVVLMVLLSMVLCGCSPPLAVDQGHHRVWTERPRLGEAERPGPVACESSESEAEVGSSVDPFSEPDDFSFCEADLRNGLSLKVHQARTGVRRILHFCGEPPLGKKRHFLGWRW